MRLFWRLCLWEPVETGSHRSEGRGGAPLDQLGGFRGLGDRELPTGVSMKSGNFSITGWTAGGLGERDEIGRFAR